MKLTSILFCLAASAQPPIQKAIDYMAAATKDGAFMGSVLVARDGKVLFSNGYGFANIEHNVPNTVDTKFRLGSITKQFAAVAVLQLEEQGKLSVKDPMCNYIPDCPDTWKPITIHHLLTHTSGLFNYTNDPEVYAKKIMLPSSQLESLEKIRNRPLRFSVGEKFEYSNSGYLALGAIIEKASGMTWDGYIKKSVLVAADMRDSGADDHAAVIKNRAAGYMGEKNAPYHDMTVPGAAGALYSTVQDLLRWDQALYSEKLLKKQNIERLFQPEKAKYAYGWLVDKQHGRTVYMHGGGIHGFTTTISRFPDEKLLVVALSNNSARATGKIGTDLAGIFLGVDVKPPTSRTAITLPAETLEMFVGKYQLAPTAIITIARDGAQLTAQLTGQDAFPIFPESKNSFFFRIVDAQLTFDIDAAGKVTGVTLHQNGRNMPAKKLM